ncbi:MAG TPA: hypothetical protein VHU80_22670 [Polyangiaceae bacterium]|nr:hypothetical protein [Polyangiaceae bacterium]
MPELSSEQTYLAFPDGGSAIKQTTHIRSTLIMSSRKTLREANLFEEYEALLSVSHQRELVETAAPRWLPLEVGLAHYQACEGLNLPPNRVVELAQGVGMQRKGTFLGVAVGLASGLGVTPWTALGQAERIWQRAWRGGAIRAHKLGDQEARLEVVGWPCARIGYCRHALRGLMLGVTGLLSSQAFVHEVYGLQRDSAVAYRLTWR